MSRSSVLVIMLMACGPQPSTLSVANRSVEYFRGGTGRSVVFESGLGDGWASWTEVISSLTKTSTVFAYSRAGYGKSSPVSGVRDGVQLAAELAEVLGAANMAPPYVLVGHSLGGQLVQVYAREHPELVIGLVLVDGRPPGFTGECLAKLDASQCVASNEQLAQFPAVMRAEYDASAATEAQLKELPVGSSPVQVVTRSSGPESEAYRELWGQAQAEQARELGAELTIVPGVGHFIHQEAPTAVLDAIKRIP